MSRATAQSRKAVKLTESLHRGLVGYALAAGATGVGVLALVQPAEAQIVYTPANKTVNSGEKLLIDLNHDGIVDVLIREAQCSRSVYFPGNSLQAVPQVGGGIQRRYPGLAAALSAGSEIGGRKLFNSRAGVMATFTNYGVYYFGSWVDFTPTSQYLGIKFSSGGETHYGWARLTVTPGYKNIPAQLTGYAYEEQPNTPIRAGDRGKNAANDTGEILTSPEPAAKPARTLGGLALGAPSLPACGWTGR